MSSRQTHGFTLVEMVIAIVIVSIGLAGVLMALNTTIRSSADPLVRKQMQAIAEEMLEEVQLKPFAASGIAPAKASEKCGGTPTPARTAFDDLSDYNDYATTGICDIDGQAVTGLANYNVAVTVVTASLGDISSLNSSDAKQVTVTVSHGTERIVLSGWRTNYAQ